MHGVKVTLLIGLSICTGLMVVHADSPSPASGGRPAIWSPNKRYCAVVDTAHWTTTIYSTGPRGERRKVWAMYGEVSDAFLSNSGESMVLAYPGIALRTDYRKDDVLFYFVRRGELVRTVPIGQLIKGKSSLVRTASHYRWGSIEGFDNRDRFVVKLIGGQPVSFDMTGSPISAGK